MLEKNIREKVVVIDKIENWENAVKLAAKPLLLDNSITENYVRSMVNNVKKFGAYIVINDTIALAHSRPEDGVKKTGISLLKLDEGVDFGENSSIRLIFILAAKDSNSHIDMITELVNMLQDDEKLNRVLNSKTENEILENLN